MSKLTSHRLAPAVLAFGTAFTLVAPFTLANAQEASAETQPSADTNAQPQQVAFQTLDGRDNTIVGVRGMAVDASQDKVVIVAWGSNQALLQEAIYAALDIRDRNIPVGIILAPDLNQVDTDANFQVYARGVTTEADLNSFGPRIGINHLDMVRPELVEMALRAVDAHFPQQLASARLGGQSPKP